MVALAALWMATDAAAQLFRRAPTAIENARIVIGDGTVIENGTILLQGDRIVAVGANVTVPDRAKRIDAQGKTVTPGLIDVAGAIGSSAFGGSNATHRAIDAFDRYATEQIAEALRHGVTTSYLCARGDRGITGLGTIVRFAGGPDGSFGKPIVEEAALCINLASGEPPLRRLATFDAIRKKFKTAVSYRESKETYAEELEEYEKKLKERAEKESDADEESNADPKKDDSSSYQKPPNRRRPGPGRGDPPNQSSDEEYEKKKEDELKKPAEPKRNPAADVLLRVIDHDLPVRIVAGNSEDILNAIELAEEFDLILILEAATEADGVARAIADAEADVVLEYRSAARPVGHETARRLDALLTALARNKVGWVIGSGSNARNAGRFLLPAVQLAGQSDPDLDVIKLLTSRAAEFLGLDETTGTIAQGRAADLVIWSGDPRDPATRVESVYASGRLVYTNDDATAAGEGEE